MAFKSLREHISGRGMEKIPWEDFDIEQVPMTLKQAEA